MIDASKGLGYPADVDRKICASKLSFLEFSHTIFLSELFRQSSMMPLLTGLEYAELKGRSGFFPRGPNDQHTQRVKKNCLKFKNLRDRSSRSMCVEVHAKGKKGRQKRHKFFSNM